MILKGALVQGGLWGIERILQVWREKSHPAFCKGVLALMIQLWGEEATAAVSLGFQSALRR